MERAVEQRFTREIESALKSVPVPAGLEKVKAPRLAISVQIDEGPGDAVDPPNTSDQSPDAIYRKWVWEVAKAAATAVAGAIGGRLGGEGNKKCETVTTTTESTDDKGNKTTTTTKTETCTTI